MKRILSLALAALLIVCCFAFTSCGKASDWKNIQDKKNFVCGITIYAPMNYIGEDDELTGFDTDFAKAVAKELGVDVSFQIISWGSKYVELNSGKIDCIWNGFTYGDEEGVSRTEYVDFSHAYLNNSQCIVTSKANLETLKTAADFAGKKAAVEGGSSGEAVAKDLVGEDNCTAFSSQVNALMELAAGRVDFVAIDVLMANAMVGKGDYADLAINPAVTPEEEVYAIGFRKGSDFTAKVNEAIAKLSENGELAKIAAKYELGNALIENIGK